MCTSAALSKRSAGCCSWFYENGASVSEFLARHALSRSTAATREAARKLARPKRKAANGPPSVKARVSTDLRAGYRVYGHADRSEKWLSVAMNGRGKKGGFHARRYLWPNASHDLSGLRSVRHGLGSAAGPRAKPSHILKPHLPAITRRDPRRHRICRALGL